MRFLVVVVAILFAGIVADNLKAGERWYEDNNRGVAGGIPGDFYSRLSNTGFRNKVCAMDVYYIRLSTARRINDFWLTRLANILNACGVETALNDNTVVWAHGRHKNPQFKASIATINKLKRLGFNVQYAAMQSVLSKKSEKYPAYRDLSDMTSRYLDIIRYYDTVGKTFPELKIGLIDALSAKLPDKEVRGIYSLIVNYLKSQGKKLHFIHIDLPIKYPWKGLKGNSWKQISALSHYIQQGLNTQFGIIITSDLGGKKSGEVFVKHTKLGAHNYAKAGMKADHWVSAAWYPHPVNSFYGKDTGLDAFYEMDIILDKWRR